MTVRRPRARVTPFLRGNVWWARVPRIGGDSVSRSLGVTGKENRDVADNLGEFLAWLRKRQEAWLLDQIAGNKTTVPLAYRAWVANRLPEFIAELRDGIKDVDVEPFVAKWVRELERRKRPNADTRAKYAKQVRAFIPEGVPFPRSKFTKQAVRDFLGGLEIGQPNRYRAALSSFAKFLVFEDVLPLNVVQQVPMAKEAEPRTLHLDQEQARRLLDALPAPYKALHALMLATGMEWSAAVAVRPEDIGDRQVYAAGTKRQHRRRTVGVYDRWLWAWDVFLAEAKPGLLTAGRIFAGVDQDKSHRALKRALALAALDHDYTTHDHRHTWAVQAIRDRLPLPMIAHNLGHRDSSMLLKVYGRYAPTGADFALIGAINSTVALPSETAE